MKKRVLFSCMIAVLGFALFESVAYPDEPEGIEGVWVGNVISADCNSHLPLPNAVPFRALYMFGHDGSVTTEAAFLVPAPPRSSGLGAWRHTEGQMFNSTFWFYRYKADGSFLSFREIAQTVHVNGAQLTTFDRINEYDVNNNVSFIGCAVSTLNREQ